MSIKSQTILVVNLLYWAAGCTSIPTTAAVGCSFFTVIFFPFVCLPPPPPHTHTPPTNRLYFLCVHDAKHHHITSEMRVFACTRNHWVSLIFFSVIVFPPPPPPILVWGHGPDLHKSLEFRSEGVYYYFVILFMIYIHLTFFLGGAILFKIFTLGI